MRPITNYEHQYVIYADGCVVNTKTNRTLKTYLSNSGYLQVDLWKDNKGTRVYLHRLLAQHYLPSIYGKCFVNHKDGNKLNNSLNNLEWVTKSENAIHALEMGLVVRPRKLSEELTLVVLKEFLSGETLTELVRDLPIQLPRLSVQIRKVASKHGLLDQYKQQVKKAHMERIHARRKQ